MGTTRIGPVNKNSPATGFRLEADVISQNATTNSSVIRFNLVAVNNGNSGSNFADGGNQVGYIQGYEFGRHSADPFLPSGFGTGATRWNDQWDLTVYHDSNGYYYGGNPQVSMYLGYGSVNETHYGNVPVPRIARTPAQMQAPWVAGITPTSMYLSWVLPDNRGSALDQIILRYWYTPDTSGPFGQYILGGNNTNYTPTDLIPGATYYWAVYARNAVGYSERSPLTVTTTLPSSPPGIQVGASLSGTQALVTLTPPGGVTGVTQYNVQYRPTLTGTPTTTLTTSATQITVSGLLPGQSYEWRANAVIGSYTSPWSDWTPRLQPNPNTGAGNYFDGSSTDTADVTYDWTGTTNLSTSTASAPLPINWRTWAQGVGSTGAVGAVVRVYDNAPAVGQTHAARVIWRQAATSAGFVAGSYGAEVEALATYVGSLWIKPSRNQRMIPRINFYDAGNVLLGGTDGDAAVITGNEWTRVHATGIAPANSVTAEIVVRDVTGTGYSAWLSGETLTMDGAMISLSSLFPYFDGSTPDAVDFEYEWLGTANASQSWRLEKAPSTADLLADPDCPPMPAPPTPPAIPSDCIDEVGVWRRYLVQVPAQDVGLWASTIPTLTLNTNSTAERQVRIRYYPNSGDIDPVLIDTASWQAELILTYIPPATELVLDGVTQRVWATVNGQGPIPANQLLYGTNGVPATWPELRCGIGYVITLDVPLDAPSGNLETSLLLTPRM